MSVILFMIGHGHRIVTECFDRSYIQQKLLAKNQHKQKTEDNKEHEGMRWTQERNDRNH